MEQHLQSASVKVSTANPGEILHGLSIIRFLVLCQRFTDLQNGGFHFQPSRPLGCCGPSLKATERYCQSHMNTDTYFGFLGLHVELIAIPRPFQVLSLARV